MRGVVIVTRKMLLFMMKFSCSMLSFVISVGFRAAMFHFSLVSGSVVNVSKMFFFLSLWLIILDVTLCKNGHLRTSSCSSFIITK